MQPQPQVPYEFEEDPHQQRIKTLLADQPQHIADQAADFVREETVWSEAIQVEEDSEATKATEMFDPSKTLEENLTDMPYRFLHPARQIAKFTLTLKNLIDQMFEAPTELERQMAASRLSYYMKKRMSQQAIRHWRSNTVVVSKGDRETFDAMTELQERGKKEAAVIFKRKLKEQFTGETDQEQAAEAMKHLSDSEFKTYVTASMSGKNDIDLPFTNK